MANRSNRVWAGASVAVAGALISTSAAHALVLPGNFWPNPTLEAASTTGQSNSPGMNPAGTWRRGGSDFTAGANPGPYTVDFWDNVAGAVSGTHALRLVDNSTTGNGEWFVPDFDLDATVVPVTPGSTLEFHFHWNYQTTAPTGVGADMRVTIRGTDGIGNFGLGSSFDFLANGTTNGQFVEADFIRTLPANTTGIRMNIASGGDSAVTGFLAVDDISVRVVPEPASAALATLGLGGLLFRRRRVA
jgi:hypothetical protein